MRQSERTASTGLEAQNGDRSETLLCFTQSQLTRSSIQVSGLRKDANQSVNDMHHIVTLLQRVQDLAHCFNFSAQFSLPANCCRVVSCLTLDIVLKEKNSVWRLQC